jgi:hypothetical protein
LLVGIGPGFPLLAYLTFPLFDVLEQLRCFRGIEWGANGFVEIGFP